MGETQTSHKLEEIKRTSRNFTHYCTVFQYGESGEEINGKTILDVGSGNSDFAQVVNDSIPNAQVYRIDPKYETDPPSYPDLAEAGFIEDTSFPDDMFDEVISSWGFSQMRVDSRKALGQMLRLTKQGGKIKLFPVFLLSRDRNVKLPHSTSLIYDVDESKVYSKKTLQIVKDPALSEKGWEGVFNELFQKLWLTDEDLK